MIIVSGFQWKQEGPVIHLIGDSTMAERTEKVEVNPERGWGQALQQYFKKDLKICNHAVNGRSTRNFIAEGRWETVRDELKPGDFVLIQFGHNDQKIKDPKRYTNPSTSYFHNLHRFVKETREKEATPVLLTSIVRRKFNEHGTLVDTHGLYPLIVRQLSQAENVFFIDHLFKTEALISQMGEEPSKELYVWVEPGQYVRFPEGKKDDTHLSKKGADVFAKMVVDELANFDTNLKKFILLDK